MITDHQPTFTHIGHSTAEDWRALMAHYNDHVSRLPDRIVTHMGLMAGDFGGFPVDRLTHSLQTATLAYRDGRDEEYVVCALLHDLGDLLGSFNHPDFAAVVLQPFVSEANHWMVKHHGIFQGYDFFHHLGLDKNMRDEHRDSPYFKQTAEFCALYDGAAFNPDLECMPLEAFEPMLRRVFAKPKNSGVYARMQPSGQ
jgi:predicted HD phosphohydrolase